MAVHAPSTPAFGRTHFGPAITRVPALQASRIGVIPSVGPRGIMVRSKVGQLSHNTTHPVSFGQSVVEAAKATTKPSNPFDQAAQAIKGAAGTSSATTGGIFGSAIQKAKDAAAAATAGGLAHGPDKLKLPAGTLDKPPLATGPTPGGVGHGVDKLKLPAGTVGDKAQIPATNGGTPSTPAPSTPKTPSHPPMGGGGYGGGGYGGGGVVVAPSADVPAATVVTSPATTVLAGQPVAQQSPACVARIPQLAAVLDALMPTAQLATAELETLKSLRIAIADLAAAGKYVAARAVEEQAMSMLGYAKVWSRCGDFAWTRQVAAAQ
jgi:hypothetical protein